ncbi:MAG: nucleoside-diphosphate kinase [Candidatus Omnitrophota bacterium]|nr:nucleoside-diphosphate kinase [Candidatus Omnitrophota bacterium]
MKKTSQARSLKKKESVLVFIKPDGMSRGLAGIVLEKFFAAGLELVAARLVTVSRRMAEEHYRHLRGKPFYEGVIQHILGTGYPEKRILAFVFAGPGAVSRCRLIAGATNPEEADLLSIRGAFGRITTKGVFENVIHVSSDTVEAEREIKLWFEPEQIDARLYPVKTIPAGKFSKKVWA